MESQEVVSLILKYFDFQQLYIAQRINSNFNLCVALEFRSLKYIDAGLLFTKPKYYNDILTKISNYCPNLSKIENFMVFANGYEFDKLLIHRVLQSLPCLVIDHSHRIGFGSDDIVLLLKSAARLEELDLYFHADFEKGLSPKLLDDWTCAISGQIALKKLKIFSNNTWVNLPACTHLTHLSINISYGINAEKWKQIYTLLEANQMLESLTLPGVPLNEVLVVKLGALRKLKMLSLDLYSSRDDFAYQNCNTVNPLCFNDLEELSVRYGAHESHLTFISHLLTSSPILKRCRLHLNSTSWASEFNFLMRYIPRPEQMECFVVVTDNYISNHNREDYSCIYDEMTKMISLRHFHTTSSLRLEDAQRIATLPDLKYLKLSEHVIKNANVMKRLCSASLEGVCLNAPINHPAFLDVVLDQCPNLRYFFLRFPNRKQVRKLPIKTPNLRFLSVIHSYRFTENLSIDEVDDDQLSKAEDLVFVIENLPNLRVLIVDSQQYALLLEFDSVKRYCRQGKLAIVKDRRAVHLREKWQTNCFGSCCLQFS